MYYIISKFDIDFWKGVHVPFIDGSLNRDSKTFWESDMGRKLSKDAPFVIKNISGKKNLCSDVAMDVAFMSLCYNCPLYIYVIKDSYYYKELDLGFASLRNFGKVSELTNSKNSEDTKNLRVDMATTYYGGKVDVIERVFCEKMSEINFKNSPVWGYTITAEKGLNRIENC